MRKNLLFVLGIIATISVFAQIPTNTIWSKSFTPITANLKMPNNQVMAVDASGAAIVTGTMMQGFTFAGKEVEALTSNANYMAKYSASGEELWAIVIDGGNVNTITTDQSGNIYIAGTFGEAISLGTTVGDAIEKEGNEEVNSTFIAQYTTNGTILKAETVTPTTVSDNSFDPPSIKFEQLLFNDGKLYVAVSNLGANGKIGDIEIKGAYYEIDYGGGFFIAFFQNNVQFIQFNDNLVPEKLLAKVEILENAPNSSYARTPRITISNDKLYLGMVACGSIKLVTPSDNKTFVFSAKELPGEGGTTDTYYEHGFIISSIDFNSNTINANVFKSFYTKQAPDPVTLSKLTFNNSSLIIVGTSENDTNPFNDRLSKTGVRDLVFTSLNDNLGINWSSVSDYNEGSNAFTDSEEFNSATIFGDKLDAMATIKNYRKNADNKDEEYISNTYLMNVDLTNGATSAPIVTPTSTIFNTGIAGNGKNLLSASVTPSESKVTFTMAGEMPSAIGEVGANVSSTIISTLVTNEIQLSEIADVTVTNLAGIVIKKEKGVDQINVSDLSSGFYFVTINGVTTKIQKI